MSDAAMTYRIVVKEIAAEHGVYATFMPKPLFGENGSGMHTHQSLFSGGKNAFYDADGDHHLRARRSHTSPACSATRARSRRCSPRTSTATSGWSRATRLPSTVAWSQRNRSALVRVPMYHPGKEQATRCELRCPDPPATRT